MKHLSLIITVTLLLFVFQSCFISQLGKKSGQDQQVVIDSLLKTDADTMAYIIGTQFGENLQSDLVDFDIDAIYRGMYDVMNQHDTLFSKQEKQLFQEKFQRKLQAKSMELMEEKAIENKAEEQQFLSENRLKKGVIETGSGLQYKVVDEYNGKKPGLKDTVKVFYEGRFVDGEVFDGNFESGSPIVYPVQGFIKGWVEGLQLMSAGSTYMFYIPADLAYGERGNQGIPPAKMLIFKIKLIEVIPFKE
jgi:FKBP-type peptidyl-prolyl cis-trans isomerase FklB